MELSAVLSSGVYVIAVSGGVDSVVLLDLLAKTYRQNSKTEFIVAHFDHGIRQDSAQDAELVRQLASQYGFKFALGHGNLGSQVSEAEARDKRYQYLRQVMQQYYARAIITAHHQDDVIETSILNILRGTGRRGLSSLKNRHDIIRPLLDWPKADLRQYAINNQLTWHEDSTNHDTKYLRNYVRIKIVNKMDDQTRQQWLAILANAARLNQQLDTDIDQLVRRGLHKNQLVLSRKWFIMLPHSLSKEVLLAIFDKAEVRDIDRKTLERLTVQIKTLPAGKVLQATGIDVYLTKRSARFKKRGQFNTKHV